MRLAKSFTPLQIPFVSNSDSKLVAIAVRSSLSFRSSLKFPWSLLALERLDAEAEAIYSLKLVALDFLWVLPFELFNTTT